MKEDKLALMAVLNALGVVIYVFLVALILSNGGALFGDKLNPIFGPIAMLLLFVFSALLVGFLVLGRPVMLYLESQKKEALKLLFYTGSWLFVFMVVFFVILMIVK